MKIHLPYMGVHWPDGQNEALSIFKSKGPYLALSIFNSRGSYLAQAGCNRAGAGTGFTKQQTLSW